MARWIVWRMAYWVGASLARGIDGAIDGAMGRKMHRSRHRRLEWTWCDLCDHLAITFSRSGGHFGSLGGHFGSLWGSFWEPLGVILGAMGAIWGPLRRPKVILSKARRQVIPGLNSVPPFLEPFGPKRGQNGPNYVLWGRPEPLENDSWVIFDPPKRRSTKKIVHLLGGPWGPMWVFLT